MIKEAINKILSLAPVEHITIEDRDFTSRSLSEIVPHKATAISAHTLTAIKDYFDTKEYFEHEGEEDIAGECLVRVVSPEKVIVCSFLQDIYRDREYYLEATCVYKPFVFNSFTDIELFNIALQAQFVPNKTTKAMLKITGNVTTEAIHKTLDDGVSQTVTAKAGIAKVENVLVPNPVELRPYRTFAEIDQPESKFIFRMKSGFRDNMPEAALFEADGGAWKLEAINNIKKWLTDNLPKGTLIIA